MYLFFDILFAVMPYAFICVVAWMLAGKLEDYEDQLDIHAKHINSMEKKIAALSKTPKKK
jgi:hypothetical protein